jgi:hypothetical protein
MARALRDWPMGRTESVAVLSDVHASREHLDAILAKAESLDISRVWCLGDFATVHRDAPDLDPAYVVERVLDACEVVIRGNHEDEVICAYDHRAHSNYARSPVTAEAWRVANLLTCQQIRRIEALPSYMYLPQLGLELAHSNLSARLGHANFSQFVDCVDIATVQLALATQPLAVIGHTHKAACFVRTQSDPRAVQKYDWPARRNFAGLADQAIITPGAGCGTPSDSRCAWWLELRITRQSSGCRHRVRWHATSVDDPPDVDGTTTSMPASARGEPTTENSHVEPRLRPTVPWGTPRVAVTPWRSWVAHGDWNDDSGPNAAEERSPTDESWLH